MRMNKEKSLISSGPFHLDLRTWPRRAARFARKTASTPRGPALTQVGRAPSLMLEAPTNCSPLEKLVLRGSVLRVGCECPETSPELGRGQAGRGDRQVLLGQRQSEPGHCGMEEVSWPLALAATPDPPPLTVAPVCPPWASAGHQPLPFTLVGPADSI